MTARQHLRWVTNRKHEKRWRATAVQDAGAFTVTFVIAKRLGVRQPSGALGGDATRVGVGIVFGRLTQGSSCLATAGLNDGIPMGFCILNPLGIEGDYFLGLEVELLAVRQHTVARISGYDPFPPQTNE